MDGPDVRIGDAERDEAVRLLREHLVAGRIDYGEFEERMTQALQARRQGEVLALFTDLPGRKPVGDDPAREEDTPRAVTARPQPGEPGRRQPPLRALAPILMLAPMLVILALAVLPGHVVLFGPLLLLVLLGRGGYATQTVRHQPGHRPYD